MQFFTVTDQSSVKHKVLVVPLSQTEMNELMGRCEKCMPSISMSAIIQIGHPYLTVDFGGADAWKTAIALDEESEDGHKIGDELEVGDILNVILTSEAKALSVSKERVYMNVPLESVLAFSILFTSDIAETYALFKMIKQPKAE
jgi:hypothetical protein